MSERRLPLKIVLRLPTPTGLTFLSGLLAGAGINMLTSAATGESTTSAGMVTVDAIAWVAAAVFLFSAAQRLETAQRHAASHTADLTALESQSEYEKQLDLVADRIVTLLILTVISLAAAVTLLPLI